jgi:hypothetical protein
LPSSSGSRATLIAIRRASSPVSTFACGERRSRPLAGQSSSAISDLVAIIAAVKAKPNTKTDTQSKIPNFMMLPRACGKPTRSSISSTDY